ncbi:E1 ubiquitin-activating protein uba2 [Blastocladiella emersonii ATCC 22665]|nr:E1 ubiquitin-activating protein uba2 [Blastocladiella emersonii ATCC 22665]
MDYSQELLGPEVVDRLRRARVLMVGAGGIGCELLKNLALTGFGHIEIVDLDTIDVTNLNRQFLFQRQHVSKSKAHVARQTASKFNDQVTIVSHHGNIKDPQFDLAWFKSFDMVFNALDNLEARRHVNLLCVAGGVPLIDAGTGGYQGQSTIIVPGLTECYDCHPKPTPKTFPVCTIRSTPSAPIHCIVWAKNFLFPLLFNTESEDNGSASMHDDTENANQVEELAREAETLKRLQAAANTPEYASMVLKKLYQTDILRLLDAKDMWKVRVPPTPLDVDHLAGAVRAATAGLALEPVRDRNQRVLSTEEAIALFLTSTARLGARFAKDGSQHFDKDDTDAMEFVAAAAILRSIVYHIKPIKSVFEIKSMAGNIVPIVGTTNAIIAGCMVHHGMQVLQGHVTKDLAPNGRPNLKARLPPSTMTLVSRPTNILSRANLSPPVPECGVCSSQYLHVALDVTKTTIGELLEMVAENCAALPVDNVSLVHDGRGLYDPDDDDMLERTLASVSVPPHHAFLRITAYDQDDLIVQPLIVYLEASQGKPGIELKGKFPTLQTHKPVPKPAAPKATVDVEDDDDELLIVDTSNSTGAVQVDDDDDIIMVD